jgi:hypothetical protein
MKFKTTQERKGREETIELNIDLINVPIETRKRNSKTSSVVQLTNGELKGKNIRITTKKDLRTKTKDRLKLLDFIPTGKDRLKGHQHYMVNPGLLEEAIKKDPDFRLEYYLLMTGLKETSLSREEIMQKLAIYDPTLIPPDGLEDKAIEEAKSSITQGTSTVGTPQREEFSM